MKRQKDRAAGQTSLFDVFGDVEGSGFEVIVPEPDGQEWDRHMKLSFEKEVLGIYVSDHPLRPYEYALAKAREFTLSQIDTGFETMGPTGNAVNQEIPEGKPYWWAGMVSGVGKRVTKNGVQLDESQKISVYEGLECITKNGAFQYGEEDRKGTLEVGKLADFCVVEHNPLKVDIDDLRDLKVLKTIKEGEIVWEA